MRQAQPLDGIQIDGIQKTTGSRVPEAGYAYYRRCQVFRRNGEQCKAPAEKGAHICHAHAGQLAMAVLRERERQAVLAEAVAEMRRRCRPECQMADLFTDFKGIQVTLAVAAQALIDGRIDGKTAGRMVVHLQMMSKLLWVLQRKRKFPPLIHAKGIDDKGESILEPRKTAEAPRPDQNGGAQIFELKMMTAGDGIWEHGPPVAQAA